MKEFKVTIKGERHSISYRVVFKTEKGAFSFGKRVAKEAFYGEVVKITIKETF